MGNSAPAASTIYVRDATEVRGKRLSDVGFFQTKISRLLIESASPNWTQAQQEILSQTSMLYDLPATPLEKIPFDFKYEFRCSDPGCKGHTMRCTDWEIGEAYRQWRRQYGDDWERPFRQRFEDEMINRYDTHFFVGNLHQRPNVWIVVELFYSPPQTTRDMFLQ
jgi:hypothetical protein